MLFSRCVEKHVATQVITYELWEHMTSVGKVHSYSIKKRNTLSDDVVSIIAKGVISKSAIDLIWSDVTAGIQK